MGRVRFKMFVLSILFYVSDVTYYPATQIGAIVAGKRPSNIPRRMHSRSTPLLAYVLCPAIRFMDPPFLLFKLVNHWFDSESPRFIRHRLLKTGFNKSSSYGRSIGAR